jgi:heparin binding hemagglutinin HbhA
VRSAEKPADKPADKATSAAAKKAPATSARVTRARAAKPTDPTAVPAKKN